MYRTYRWRHEEDRPIGLVFNSDPGLLPESISDSDFKKCNSKVDPSSPM